MKKERIDITKLGVQSKNHMERIQHITKINGSKTELLNRLGLKDGIMGRKESQLWRKAWDAQNLQTDKLLKSEKLYQPALKEAPLNQKGPSKAQSELLEKYELNSVKPLNSTVVRRIQDTVQNIDLTVTR